MKCKHLAGCTAVLLTLTALAPAVLPAGFGPGPGVATAQSLWGGPNIFADRKAREVGDILTIVISESTSLSTSKKSSNQKSGSTSLSAGVGIFDFLKAASASGSANGNMVVEGTQSIWQNRNEHKITLRGVCRQDDVTASNTIPSTKIADATLKFDGKGPLNAKQRQGILTQIFNILF